MRRSKSNRAKNNSTALKKDVRKIFPDPEAWLDTPNEHLMGRTPRELLGTEREILVSDLLWRIKHGIPT